MRKMRLIVMPTVVTGALIAGGLVPTLAPVAAAAVTANPSPLAGTRNGATRIPFTISDRTALNVDVGSGNAVLTDNLFTLPGIISNTSIGLTWNSTLVGSSTPSSVTGTTGSGWSITGFDQRLQVNPDDSVTYFGAGGLTGVFAPVGGSSTSYVSPFQFKANLTALSGGGWSLVDHDSQTVLTFTTAGRLTTVADRNGNLTRYGYSSGLPASVVTTRGGWTTTSPTLRISTVAGRLDSISEQTSTLSRTVRFGFSASGNLNSVTDTAGAATQFASASGTDTALVAAVTSPIGATTTLSYGSGQVTAISQTNTAPGSAGTSVTRLEYPSTTTTLLAVPTTDQAQAVSAVPHTTYTLTLGDLVKRVVDPDGNSRSTQFTPFGDTSQITSAAGGVSTFGYSDAVNGGESATSTQGPGGAASSASYANTGGTQYLPSSTTDDATNSYVYTYNGTGNQLTSAQGTGPQAVMGYNSFGQVTTSRSPGAATSIRTAYTYDGTTGANAHNLLAITPVSGAGLGVRNFSWDSFGRLATAEDGRGNMLSYSYDQLDRVIRIAYSDTTPDVTVAYDTAGRAVQRVDGAGTTSYAWDDLARLLSTSNSAGGGSVQYTYDRAGAPASKTDNSGTTSYAYDDAHLLTSLVYPQGSGVHTARFGYDSYGRRTDVWLQSNVSHTTWTAHQSTTYDTTGRVTATRGEIGPATAPTAVVDQLACYNTGAGRATCSTSGSDRTKIQWVKDSVTGEVSSYGYDTSGRLKTVTVTGGQNPRTYTYTYDGAGNRTAATSTGTSPTSQTLTYNNANQITSSGYAYDAAGNQVASPSSTASYNAAGQMTAASKAGVTSAYTYAGNNSNELLSATNQSGSTYHYVYGKNDQNGLPEVEQVSIDGGTGPAYIQHDPTTGSPLILHPTSGTNSLYMSDITGNPVLLASNSQSVTLNIQFDPYGAATQNGSAATTTTNPYLFHYGIQDRTTGNVKFGARWYDSKTGTWTQQDGYNAPLDPANANRYQYASGDPVNIADPTGADGSYTLSNQDIKYIKDGVVAAGALITAGLAATGVGVPGAFIAALVTILVNFGLSLIADSGCGVEVTVHTIFGVPAYPSAGLVDCP